ERDGTNNENLPETHEILKRIRAEVDSKYPDRMLLAEANQWPEDTRPYFGDGDECHTAFHFPLMPRMYMALAQEDRYPITDILRQTPEIPENCQWALFLRNHDELTLEMVTEDERDYLWRTYASDARARINLGIRRRLSPLLQNDRRKIELLNALLLSMPGTPVIYYGDEIGMGDNYYLGDRDGVRTPMQWTADRNGGFSRADPQRLYLPPIMDANYGYQAINVEAQQRDQSSLLNWMRKIISVRKRYQAFGRGEQTFLYPRNRKVLAFLREHDDKTLLCVFNMSRTAQAVELDLSAHIGAVPVELMGSSAFPPVGELPYLLTLPAHGFFWFELTREAEQPDWHVEPEEAPMELTTIVMSNGIASLLDGAQKYNLERFALPDFLMRRRWFAGKNRRISALRFSSVGTLGREPLAFPFGMLDVELSDRSSQRYFLPVGVQWGGELVQPGSARLPSVIAKVRRGARIGALLDAAVEPDFARAILTAIQTKSKVETDRGRLIFEPIGSSIEIDDDAVVRSIGAEQSNVSMIVDDRFVVKVYRRIRTGIQPELEVSRFLSDVAHYDNAPALHGLVELIDDSDQSAALASVFEFVPNQGDGWSVIVDALERQFEDISMLPEGSDEAKDPWAHLSSYTLDFAGRLGQRTAELHAAFAIDTDDPAFRREAIASPDMQEWVEATREEADRAFANLAATRSKVDEQVKAVITQLEDLKGELAERLEQMACAEPVGIKTRIHGDYHLGQVLVSGDDAIIIDFEGEPGRPLDERRRKTSPMRDVAGMLRSFDYAAFAALDRRLKQTSERTESLLDAARQWHALAHHQFLDNYVATARKTFLSTPEEMAAASAPLQLFLLQKAFYEISYEAANRPGWLAIPLRGVLDLLTTQGSDPS
ncbi:MAG: putative maltokinase, partial [Alphaproteobacteria bacterium]|nr:putative maltokinase [Alphaproteobacteria bacterium]